MIDYGAGWASARWSSDGRHRSEREERRRSRRRRAPRRREQRGGSSAQAVLMMADGYLERTSRSCSASTSRRCRSGVAGSDCEHPADKLADALIGTAALSLGCRRGTSRGGGLSAGQAMLGCPSRTGLLRHCFGEHVRSQGIQISDCSVSRTSPRRGPATASTATLYLTSARR